MFFSSDKQLTITIMKFLEELEMALEKYTLDPRFMSCGRFLHVNHKFSYHPSHRDGGVHRKTFFNFLEYSMASTTIGGDDLNASDFLSARKLISQHVKTERFKKAMLDQYNCVHIECVMYPFKELVRENTMSGKWWVSRSGVDRPISDWWGDDFKNEWKEIDAHASANEKIEYHELRVSFSERHFTDAEFEELKAIKSLRDDNGAKFCINQPKRWSKYSEKLPSRFEEYVDYTFLCSGRRIKYEPESHYVFSYYEIDPIYTCR